MKSQPLHNFSLPDLKWAMNQPNHHRFRKPATQDADSDSESRRKDQLLEAGKSGAASSSSGHKSEKIEMQKAGNGSDSVAESSENKSTAPSGRSKILIRLRTKSQKPAEEVADAGAQNLNAEETEELVAKTWNLRPRRMVPKVSNAGVGGVKIAGPAAQAIKTQRPGVTRSRNPTDGKAAKKKEKKLKFSISLSREEIEEDIFAMTGSRPSRRPKKRAKNVQKQLDCVFPGLWLPSITCDSYRVPDAPAKKGKSYLLAGRACRDKRVTNFAADQV
ncbi:hypothetical protein SLA2020_249830 [Shorea laevis]